jgi:hypothetical protein
MVCEILFEAGIDMSTYSLWKIAYVLKITNLGNSKKIGGFAEEI